MFSEKDHIGDLSFGAKAAWVLVAFVFLFLFIPALIQVPPPPQPERSTYTTPLTCYEGTEPTTSRAVLICDKPVR